MNDKIKILGIETSCDETSIALVDSDRNIIMQEIYSQAKTHAQYGGVIPEIAARSHIDILPQMLKDAITKQKIDLNEIDGIAVTAGPGLIGGLIVGVMVAKGLASSLGIPCIPVNHLEGHALTARLTDATLDFPYLLLLVSGGHCQLLIAKDVGKYEILGETKDDAAGEAFDKVAKMLGLGYPGGPIIEKVAKYGNPRAFQFPRAFFKEEHCNFSFSGLKTAVLREIKKSHYFPEDFNKEFDENNLNDFDKFRANIAASFQYAVGDALCDRVETAFKMCSNDIKKLVIAGGVAANTTLRNMLIRKSIEYGIETVIPPIELCTDNAAMIAWVGVEKIYMENAYDLSFEPKSRWPLYNTSL